MRNFSVRFVSSPLRLLLGSLLLCSSTLFSVARSDQKNVRLHNEANVNIDVFWVHPGNKSIHKMTAENEVVTAGMTIDLKSFAGHEFEIHETGACDHGPEQICRRVIFQVNEKNDQSKYKTQSKVTSILWSFSRLPDGHCCWVGFLFVCFV